MTGAAPTLAERLRRRIRDGGPITVADYMAEAVAHYYATRDPLGAAGDFVTAPEVSQVFGELIGLWCADLWQRMGAPRPVILAELGPGRGTLMADLLRAARAVPPFAAALRLHLVETSPALRQIQARTLAEAAPQWHASPADLPEGPLLLVANEFLDALPVRQFVRAADGWHERRVGLAPDGEDLAFTLDAAPAAAAALLGPAARYAAPGSVSEVSPEALSLAALMGARLAKSGGAALFIDYGYYPSAAGDTLQAVRRHARHDVLAAPGEADLTAHVDFAAIAAAAEAAGARAWGPVGQGAFLGALGIAARAEALRRKASPRQSADLDAACRRLLDAHEMGTLFKVLALTPRSGPAPAGFALSEERTR